MLSPFSNLEKRRYILNLSAHGGRLESPGRAGITLGAFLTCLWTLRRLRRPREPIPPPPELQFGFVSQIRISKTRVFDFLKITYSSWKGVILLFFWHVFRTSTRFYFIQSLIARNEREELGTRRDRLAGAPEASQSPETCQESSQCYPCSPGGLQAVPGIRYRAKDFFISRFR